MIIQKIRKPLSEFSEMNKVGISTDQPHPLPGDHALGFKQCPACGKRHLPIVLECIEINEAEDWSDWIPLQPEDPDLVPN